MNRPSPALAAAIAAALLSGVGQLRADDPVSPGPRPGDTDWHPPAAEFPDDGTLRILVFGAHPDDAELKAGGTAAKWAAAGHRVKFVSATNGDIGHWRTAGGPLARRRTAEVAHAAELLGIEASEVLDIHDGELMPTLENRRKFVRLIREWGADVVISHRPNDYHPDHRYCGILMQDAAFMVTVPHFCPDTPYLTENPVFLYLEDYFEKPARFEPDVVVSLDDAIDRKLDAVVSLESQFLEGGCCSGQRLPPTDADRPAAVADLRERFRKRFRQPADRFREELIARYGTERGRRVEYAEAFEVCEYGRRPSAAELRELFPDGDAE